MTLTRREAEMLTAGACEYFHRMKEINDHEIYGALIVSPNVLACRKVWQKLEDITKIGEWPETQPTGM